MVPAMAMAFGSGSAWAGDAVFPGAEWATKSLAEVGLNVAGLEALAEHVGGRGCVVRHGYMVHAWGDQSKRADVASACKPWFAHFLFKALEQGRIEGLDQKLSELEPRLKEINEPLGYKDRDITWRHVANQTSCYGVVERPGRAFCYNDWQMALFWDALFLKVYSATYQTVDARVLQPLLGKQLQCQDHPTFMAFGPKDRPGRLAISVRDFARFGLLYLHQGTWRGQQLIGAEYARMAVTSPLPNSVPRAGKQAAEMISGQRTLGSKRIPDNQTDHSGSYSWLWWINGVDRKGQRMWPDAPLDTFGAFGHGGVRGMFVMPSFDIVVSYNDAPALRGMGGGSKNRMNKAMKLLVEAAGAGPLPGQIVVDREYPQWLKYHGGGPFFMCGPGDPEGFLYRGERNADGSRSGDQMQLINKLKGTGANCIYLMAVRSHGGDAHKDPTDPADPKFQNPFVDGDPAAGLDQDILDQWETWFTEMDRNGIVILFFLYDDEARIWDTGDVVGPAERKFIHGIVDRFEHHKLLIWCVAEEYQERYSAARVSNIAAEIRAADDHDHVIAVHKLSGLDFSDFADDPNVDQFAIQYNPEPVTPQALHAGMVKAWHEAAGRYNLNMSEIAYSAMGTGTERRLNIWAIVMGGAYVMINGMDIKNTAVSDLEDCGRVVRFFESTNFHEMAPHDELKDAGTQYVLARPGHSYIGYSSALKGQIGLKNMTAGTYSFRWLDCASGMTVDQADVAVAAGNQSWDKPPAIGFEVAAHIRRTSGR